MAGEREKYTPSFCSDGDDVQWWMIWDIQSRGPSWPNNHAQGVPVVFMLARQEKKAIQR